MNFGSFVFDRGSHELYRGGIRIRLQPQPTAILEVLLERPNEIVTRKELQERLWSERNVFIDYDHALNRSVNKLRVALSDSPTAPKFIETIPARGYRFIATVETVEPEDLRHHHGRQVTAPSGESVRSIPSPNSKTSAERELLPPIETQALTARRPFWPSRAAMLWLLLPAMAVLAALQVIRAITRPSARVADSGGSERAMRLAVLPVVNLTGDPNREYLADGLTESITSDLASLNPKRLQVIARTSAMLYKESSKSISQIGHELKLEFVLESSLRMGGGRLHLTTQLVRVGDEAHLWSAEYDAEDGHLLEAQERLASDVADRVHIDLLQQPISVSGSTTPGAYREYMIGRYLWAKRRREALLEARSHFLQAIQLDSKYAAAYAGLAQDYLVLGGGYMNSLEAYRAAREYSERALAIDPHSGDAHTASAYLKFINDWDWQGAEREYRSAIALQPFNPTAHHWYAIYLAAFRRFPEALAEIDKALEYDPADQAINYNRGAILIQSGRYSEAITQLRHTLELEPGSQVAHGYLALTYLAMKDYKTAQLEFEAARKLSGTDLPYIVGVGQALALEGRRQETLRILRRLEKNHTFVPAYGFALLYTSLGETDQAFRWLSKSIEDRSCTLTEINTDRSLDLLRRDPRFSSILGELRMDEGNRAEFSRKQDHTLVHSGLPEIHRR